MSISSLPTIDISSTISSGELTPTTAGCPETPLDMDKKQQSFNEHSKEDMLLVGAAIVIYGSDDDLPSYYAASRRNSRPHSSAPSAQVVPTDVDPSSETHIDECTSDEHYAI